MLIITTNVDPFRDFITQLSILHFLFVSCNQHFLGQHNLLTLCYMPFFVAPFKSLITERIVKCKKIDFIVMVGS